MFRLRPEKLPSQVIVRYILFHSEKHFGAPVRTASGCGNANPALNTVRAKDPGIECEAIPILYSLRTFPLEQFARFLAIKFDSGSAIQRFVAGQAKNVENTIGPVKAFAGKVA